MKNLVEYCDVYRDGQCWAVVETGQPHEAVRIGVGDTLEDAYGSLEGTPIQSVGRDCGLASALSWAESAGWISSVAALEPVDDAELFRG